MHESSPYVSPRHDHSHDRRISDRDDNETEDYPLKFTSSYSLEGTNPSGTAELRLRGSSTENELDKYSEKNKDVSEILIDFCGRTSSHGIPHIGSSSSLAGKLFWTVIFLACSVAFILHTYHTIIIYLEYSVILQMQVEFNPPRFPAVTVCNLNPYKMSLFSNVTQIKEQRIFDLSYDGETQTVSRFKRQVYYEPVYARCRCLSPPHKECVPSTNEWEQYSTCLCYLDVNSGNIWPCYDEKVWTDHRCANCSTTNACPFPPRGADLSKGEVDEECMCQSISKFCVKRPQGQIQMWEGYKYGIHEPTSEHDYTFETSPRPRTFKNSETNFIEASEGVSYIAAKMDEETRRNFSYSREEFLILCSFNGDPCQKDRDFRIHDTPRHGNCFSYNNNASVVLTNSRAGPLYGLRLLLNVNQSDYLPYIEGAGVRVVVHHQNQHPFPDTFGYSAPTGAISSFGLKYKHFQRKGDPWSKCIVSENYDKKDYHYDEEYSTEGCYRSCLQNVLVQHCGCGSHRFPAVKNDSICDFFNDTHKECINLTEDKLNKHNNCSCLQPCSEPVYQTSYSAASWPADNFRNIKLFDTMHCMIAQRNNQSCIEYYRKHTAFIEVFYEQLNYEKLTEVEAYTIFSLFADFGGNIGLWIGFSTITVVEFLELALELFYHCYYASVKPIRKRSRTKSMFAAQYINQVAEQSYHRPKDFTVESSLSSVPENNENKFHTP